MSNTKPTGAATRERVESGIWRRTTGSGEVYEVTFRDAEGRQRRQTVNGGITAARRALTDAHAKRNRGERVTADPRLTFDRAADEWWTGRATSLSVGTQSAYGASLARLRREFGRRRLIDVTSADVARYIAGRRRLKGYTLRGDLNVLGSVFKYAARHLGAVAPNPVSGLERRERPSIDDKRDHRVLDMDELVRLVASTDTRYRLLVRFASETGARLSEVLGLAWADLALDPVAPCATFALQLSRAGERVPLKTATSRRTVEITPALARELREHKAASSYSRPHDLVWTTREGKGLEQRNVGGRVLSRAVKAAGLQAVERDGRVVLRAPTFHDLRHTHASALIASGWDLAEVSRRLGHADPSITSRIYAHAFEHARRGDERRDRLATLYAAGDGARAAKCGTPSDAGATPSVVALR